MNQFPERVTVLDQGRRQQKREQVEKVLELARHLPAKDRLLLEQVYRYGMSVSDVARLLGKPQKQVRGRVSRLLKRLRHPLFGFLVVRGELLPAGMRRVAEMAYFEGFSQRGLAAATGLTLHQVRLHLYAVTALARY